VNWSDEEVRSSNGPTDTPGLWYPAAEQGDDQPPPIDWESDSAPRSAVYVAAIDNTRFDIPVLGASVVNPRTLERFIPPRRGQVQGPALRPDGTPIDAGGLVGTPRSSVSAPAWRPPETVPATGEREKPRGVSLGAVASMATGTLVSRLTGMLRQLVTVAALGTVLIGSDYTVANTVPNIIYILVIGGALNSVFVPQLVRAMQRDKDGGEAYTNRLLTVTIVGLLILTVLAVLGAPLIVDLFTQNATKDEYALTVTFARYCLPQIFFYGLFVMFGQILNARDRFGPMMWTTVLNNVVVIATFTAYMVVAHGLRTAETISPQETRLLGLGTTLGIVVQTLTLIPYLRQVGVRYRPRFDWRGVGLGQAFTLAKWTILFVLVNQLGNLVVTRLAYAIDVAHPNGGLGYTAYTNAFIIFGLPQAVVTVSLITAMLPRMSRAAAHGDLRAVRDDVSHGLRVSGVVIVPASVAFVALGPQIATVLFLHGQMNVSQARAVGYMLMAFGGGLIPFSAQYLMLRGFYAFEDTRTPFTINVWIASLNALFAFICYETMKNTRWAVVGMCVGYSLAYLFGMWLTARRLSARMHGIDASRVRRTYSKLAVASLPAGVVGFVIGLGAQAIAGQAFFGSLLAVVFGLGGMGLVFLVLAKRMRIEELGSMLAMVRGRLGR
jgi:putative peptidoglycan lipid II flippase